MEKCYAIFTIAFIWCYIQRYGMTTISSNVSYERLFIAFFNVIQKVYIIALLTTLWKDFIKLKLCHQNWLSITFGIIYKKKKKKHYEKSRLSITSPTTVYWKCYADSFFSTYVIFIIVMAILQLGSPLFLQNESLILPLWSLLW